MTPQLVDLTNAFNQGNGSVTIDVGGWNYVVAHIIANTAAVNFKASNDGGAVQGSVDESPQAAINFVAIQGVNLTTGVAAGTIGATAGVGSMFSFGVVGKYLQFSGTINTVSKLLVSLSKIK